MEDTRREEEQGLGSEAQSHKVRNKEAKDFIDIDTS